MPRSRVISENASMRRGSGVVAMERGTSSLSFDRTLAGSSARRASNFRSASTLRRYTTTVTMSTRRDDAASQVLSEGLHDLRASAPASRWLEAYPVGNGVRGAMCAGLAGGERLWLNDITAWSGHADAEPLEGAVDRGRAALEDVRTAIADDD